MRFSFFIPVLYCSITVPILHGENVDYDDDISDDQLYYTHPPSNKTTKKPPQKGIDGTVYSIQEFLDTTEKIWVYNSTEETNVTCRVEVFEDVNPLYASVKRYSLSNDAISTIDANAVLSFHPKLATVQDPANEMKLENERNSNPYETLLYMSKSHDCGVFYINYHSELHLLLGTWFELRIRNSSLARGPDPMCSFWFEQFSSQQHVTYTYTPECLCMLQRIS
uniref:Putative lipocalin-3 1 n=1 Tax=Hyalomma excavatum TaxID=257692 RepID=A0A131XKK3_9ACAR